MLLNSSTIHRVEISVDLKKGTAFTALFLRAVFNNDFVLKGPLQQYTVYETEIRYRLSSEKFEDTQVIYNL
jgi:hypothetical protein